MKNNPDQFLRIAGFFAPDLPLPMDFIARLLDASADSLASSLTDAGLVQQLPVGMLLSVAPGELSQPDEKPAKQVSEAVIGHLEKAFRHHNKVKQLQTFQPIGPHLVRLIEALEPFALPEQWKLYALMAQYLMLVGKAETACGYFHQAASHYPEPIAPLDAVFNQLRLQTADAETACGNTELAAALVRCVIEEEQQAQGYPAPLHLAKLAQIAFRDEDYAQAIQLYQQAIETEQAATGDKNLAAAHWNNLGRVYLAAGQTEAAIHAFNTAAETWQHTEASEHHVNRALALKNLALAYQQQEQYPQAQAAIEAAIQLSEQAYGKDHPDIGRDANIYARILQAQGQFSAALEQFRRALRIDTHSFGPHHPEVALTLNNMGTLYAEMGQLDKARQNLQDARDLLQKCVSEEHPYWRQVAENIERLNNA